MVDIYKLFLSNDINTLTTAKSAFILESNHTGHSQTYLWMVLIILFFTCDILDNNLQREMLKAARKNLYGQLSVLLHKHNEQNRNYAQFIELMLLWKYN